MQGSWREKYQRYKSYLLNTVDRYEERTDVRIYLEILLSLITVSVFAVFALRPTILTIAELIKEIEAKQELVDQLDSKIDTITTAQILFDRERDNISLLRQSIPSSPEMDSLIYQLEGLVQKNDLRATNLSISETPLISQSKKKASGKGNNEPTSILFDIRLGGNYVSLFNFVNDIDTLLKPINIINTSIISREDEETGTVTLQLSLSGELPYKSVVEKSNN